MLGLVLSHRLRFGAGAHIGGLVTDHSLRIPCRVTVWWYCVVSQFEGFVWVTARNPYWVTRWVLVLGHRQLAVTGVGSQLRSGRMSQWSALVLCYSLAGWC